MIHFYYSPPGEVSEHGCWVAMHECWIYFGDSLAGAAKECFDNWQKDSALC